MRLIRSICSNPAKIPTGRYILGDKKLARYMSMRYQFRMSMCPGARAIETQKNCWGIRFRNIECILSLLAEAS